jgi:hypothetical protein
VHARRESIARLAGLGDREPEEGTRGERHCARHIHRDDRVDRDIRREFLNGPHDLVPGDHDLRAVVLELVAQLAWRVERVVLDHDRTQSQHGIEGDDVLRAVRQHERYGVALLHPEVAQTVCRAQDLVTHLGVRRGAAEELESDVVGVGRDRLLDEVVEGTLGQRDLVGHAVGV